MNLRESVFKYFLQFSQTLKKIFNKENIKKFFRNNEIIFKFDTLCLSEVKHKKGYFIYV